MASPIAWAPVAHAVEGTEERQSIEEVRNTVINLLKALVEKGLLTREQAELMVKQAQDKAAADQAAAVARNAQQAKEEQAGKKRGSFACLPSQLPTGTPGFLVVFMLL